MNENIRLIGLSGNAFVGKDTFADHLRARTRGDWRKISLAGMMKYICEQVYAFSEEQLHGSLKEVPDSRYPRADGTFLTPREALQRLGTEWGRKCWEDTWIMITLRRASDIFLFQGAKSVVPDCRFENELRAIRAAGGKIIRIKRAAAQKSAFGGHASETEQQAISDSYFDAVIEAEEGLENYYRQIDRLLSDLGVLP